MGKGKGKGKAKKEKKEKKEKVSHSHDYYQDQIEKAEDVLTEVNDALDAQIVEQELVGELMNQIDEDKHDICSYINRMIREQEICMEIVDDRKGQLIDTSVTEGLKTEIENNKNDIDRVLNEKTHEKRKAKAKINEMSELSAEKKQIEALIASHEQKLIEDHDTFKEELYTKEKASLQARDKKKVEMVRRVKQLTNDFKKLSSDQVSTTSKQAIRTNQTLWEGLNRLDTIARGAIDKNETTKVQLQQAISEMKIMEYSDEQSGGTTGTLPIFRRENARKAQTIQELVREYREIEERIENLESRENELEAVEAELEELSTQSSDEYMSEKLDFLTENIETTKSELESYSKLMETTITESNRLRQLALLILDDLDNRNGLVDSTAQMILKTIGSGIDSAIADSIKCHYKMGDTNFIPRH